MKVVALRKDTLQVIVNNMLEEFPLSTRGLVCVFDEEGLMNTQYNLTAQQMALLSVRLSHLANEALDE